MARHGTFCQDPFIFTLGALFNRGGPIQNPNFTHGNFIRQVGIGVLQMNEKYLLSITEAHDLFHEVRPLLPRALAAQGYGRVIGTYGKGLL
jgi:hypothetical protein